jgi:hypothetical protein
VIMCEVSEAGADHRSLRRLSRGSNCETTGSGTPRDGEYRYRRGMPPRSRRDNRKKQEPRALSTQISHPAADPQATTTLSLPSAPVMKPALERLEAAAAANRRNAKRGPDHVVDDGTLLRATRRSRRWIEMRTRSRNLASRVSVAVATMHISSVIRRSVTGGPMPFGV